MDFEKEMLFAGCEEFDGKDGRKRRIFRVITAETGRPFEFAVFDENLWGKVKGLKQFCSVRVVFSLMQQGYDTRVYLRRVERVG